MEITQQELEKFIEDLIEINNALENMMISIADLMTSMRGELNRLERMSEVMATIAQQPAVGPS